MSFSGLGLRFEGLGITDVNTTLPTQTMTPTHALQLAEARVKSACTALLAAHEKHLALEAAADEAEAAHLYIEQRVNTSRSTIHPRRARRDIGPFESAKLKVRAAYNRLRNARRIARHIFHQANREMSSAMNAKHEANRRVVASAAR